MCFGARTGSLLHVEQRRGQSGLIMRDLTCRAEELGFYPEGTREPCEGFKEELCDQLDLRKLALGAGWR